MGDPREGMGGKVYLWGKGTSSLGNVYLSKQYTFMPDRIIKRLLLKQFQVSKIPGMWTELPGIMWKFQVNDGGHRIWKRKRKKPGCWHKHLFLLRYQYAITSDKNTRNMAHILQRNSHKLR